jgi:hypothetical protein
VVDGVEPSIEMSTSISASGVLNASDVSHIALYKRN